MQGQRTEAYPGGHKMPSGSGKVTPRNSQLVPDTDTGHPRIGRAKGSGALGTVLGSGAQEQCYRPQRRSMMGLRYGVIQRAHGIREPRQKFSQMNWGRTVGNEVRVLEKIKAISRKGWRSKDTVVSVRPGTEQCRQCERCGEEAGAVSIPVAAGNQDRTYSPCGDKA